MILCGLHVSESLALTLYLRFPPNIPQFENARAKEFKALENIQAAPLQ